MNRITRTTIHVARTDWAPYIEAAARAIATAAAFVYTAGYCTGEAIHRLNASLAAWASARHRLTPEERAMCHEVLASAPVVQRQAAVPHRAAIAAPRVHPAVTLAASGLSQRAIAAKLGCTRYEVRKALKG
jgi:DNA-binding CsgD family transcriptional regulator